MPNLLNTTLFTLGLCLQLALILLLYRRRLASHLPIFTALLAFYTLRSALLFTLHHHLSPETYAGLFNSLSLLDLLLQCALAISLARVILSQTSGPLLPRALLVPAIFLLSAALTAALVAALPPHSPAPVDRAVVLTGLLFLQLLPWAASSRITGLTRTVLTGLAIFGAAGILSQTGKCLAAAHRSRPAFAAFTYLGTAAYLAVLIFWIIRCRPDRLPAPV